MARKGVTMLNVYVDNDFVAKIKEEAKKNKISTSAYIRLTLVEKLRAEEERLKKPC